MLKFKSINIFDYNIDAVSYAYKIFLLCRMSIFCMLQRIVCFYSFLFIKHLNRMEFSSYLKCIVHRFITHILCIKGLDKPLSFLIFIDTFFFKNL
jgi:hypothetical protein